MIECQQRAARLLPAKDLTRSYSHSQTRGASGTWAGLDGLGWTWVDLGGFEDSALTLRTLLTRYASHSPTAFSAPDSVELGEACGHGPRVSNGGGVWVT